MMKSKFNFSKFTLGLIFGLQLAGAGLIFSCPLPASAQTTIQSLNFVPQVTIPNSEFNGIVPVGSYQAATGIMSSDLLARYIKAFYNYGLAAAGILAAIILMGGGVLWLTSGGDSGKVGQAKELITGSIVGVVILVCAWVILNTINPNLVNLQPIETIVVKKISYCCDSKLGNVMMDKDGKCTSGLSCTGTSICTNTKATGASTNSFICLDKTNYNCCQYAQSKGSSNLYCLAYPKDQACPVKAPNGYAYDTSRDSWCATGVWNSITGPNTGCLDKTTACADAKDTSGCSLEGSGSGTCYNNLCWTGMGAENEPCGNRGGSICYAPNNGENCGKSKNGAELYTDSSGGRNCKSGLWCCNTSK